MKKLNPSALAKRLEARMADDLADGRIGGAGLCVMQDGKEIYKGYFGKKNQANNISLCDLEDGDSTLFRLASMTKPITAVATLIQVSRGLIDLDEPITKWLPEFADMDIGQLDENRQVVRVGKAQHTLTPRMLLNHTNGLGSMEVGDVQFAAMSATDKQDLDHVLACYKNFALAFEPTTEQYYSPVAAFDLLAKIVEITSGMTYDKFLKVNIFDPCGMTNTTFAPTPDQWARMITMHGRQEVDGKGVSIDSPVCEGCVFGDFPVTWFAGGASLASTLPDYVKFAEMLVRGGVTADGTRIVSEALIKEMGSPQVPDNIMGPPQQWGLAVRVITGPCHMPVGCFGWSGAYGSHFWIDPANKITAVYMKNSSYDGGAGAVSSVHFEEDIYASLEA